MMWIVLKKKKFFTDGGDDSSGEEEGAALVPVAGVVGHVFDRAHPRAHGIDGVLQRSRAHIIYHDSSSAEGFKVTIACQLG